MSDRKEKLFPYFAYLYSQKLNPEKYGNVESIEQWSKVLGENKEDLDKITKAASELKEEDWDSLEKQYRKESEPQYAKNGAKLKYLEHLKKGGKKKCKCGCEMIEIKEKGGKIVSKCGCNCSGGKMNKKRNGGKLNESEEEMVIKTKAEGGIDMNPKSWVKGQSNVAEPRPKEVKTFQKQNGLVVDGIYGPKTKALFEKLYNSGKIKESEIVMKQKGGELWRGRSSSYGKTEPIMPKLQAEHQEMIYRRDHQEEIDKEKKKLEEKKLALLRAMDAKSKKENPSPSKNYLANSQSTKQKNGGSIDNSTKKNNWKEKMKKVKLTSKK